MARIAKEVNKHHHTKTCSKHDTTCRFSYPRYPSPQTIIVEACTGENQEEIDAKLPIYRRVLTDLLNRVRIGQHMQADLDLLKTRVPLAKHPDLRKADLYIVGKRKECAKLNHEYLNSLRGELISIKAIMLHKRSTSPGLNPKKGQLLQHPSSMN